MEVNGRTYNLWGQFVERKNEWIGGVLEDIGDNMDRRLGSKPNRSVIVDIKLEANGEDSAFFCVVGNSFECGFDVKHGGISAGEEGYITFSGYGGHTWRIRQPKSADIVSA